jgi:hypothetical protein
MGLFDSVWIDCPNCGRPVEFQSKADGDPCCRRFSLDDAPTHILTDILNAPEHCMGCGQWMAIVDPAFPPAAEPPRPKPEVVKVRTPEKPWTHKQGMKWWPEEEPFTFADIANQ